MEERGWDPNIKKYFRRIISTVSWSLLWLLSCATAGIYFELGYRNGKPVLYTVIFYAAMLISGLLLARYLYRTWKDGGS